MSSQPSPQPGSSQQDSAPKPAVQPCPLAPTWVEFRLVDMEGNPVGDVQYKVTDPDGKVKEGKLGKDGKVRLDGIHQGTCLISFPELDRDNWERV